MFCQNDYSIYAQDIGQDNNDGDVPQNPRFANYVNNDMENIYYQQQMLNQQQILNNEYLSMQTMQCYDWIPMTNYNHCNSENYILSQQQSHSHSNTIIYAQDFVNNNISSTQQQEIKIYQENKKETENFILMYDNELRSIEEKHEILSNEKIFAKQENNIKMILNIKHRQWMIKNKERKIKNKYESLKEELTRIENMNESGFMDLNLYSAQEINNKLKEIIGKYKKMNIKEEEEKESLWIKLECYTNNDIECYLHPINIDNEIIIIPVNSDWTQEISTNLYSYNNMSNKWSLFGIHSNNLQIYHNCPILYNSKKIYLFDTADISTKILTKCHEYNIKTKQWNEIILSSLDQFISNVFCANGTIFGIGNNYDENKRFKIYDLNHKDQQTKPNIYDVTKNNKNATVPPMVDYGMIYVKSIKRLFIFGGFSYWNDTFEPEISDEIHMFSIYNKEWSYIAKLTYNLKLPNSMHGFGFVLSSDERYIILLGGKYQDRRHHPDYNTSYTDRILVLRLQTMQFSRSLIKCPIKSLFYAVIVTNQQKVDDLVCGYMKYENQNIIIHQDVKHLIVLWYGLNDIIHLFERNTNKHWKLESKYIINNLSKRLFPPRRNYLCRRCNTCGHWKEDCGELQRICSNNTE